MNLLLMSIEITVVQVERIEITPPLFLASMIKYHLL